MHSMEFYVSTCRCVMQANTEEPETWADLYRLLPCLRQSLSCYVCTKILSNPIGPSDNVCRHFVCKKCRGGKMKLKPSCSWCKDHSKFEENLLLKILVTSFIKLCEYIYASPIGRKISADTVNGETNSLISILQEAIIVEDDYVVKTSQPGLNTGEQTKETVKIESTHPVPGCSNNEDMSERQSEMSADDEKVEVKDIKESTDKSEDKYAIPQVPDNDLERNTVRKSQKKMVVFLKRAAKNRQNKRNQLKLPRKTTLLKVSKAKTNHLSRLTKREPISDIHPVVPVSAENDPENEQSKRLKLDLPPPKLKPPSFCRCGKSGRYNQLTCLGQRCPCYSMKLPCIGCKCKGCRNPKKGPPSSGQDHFSSTVLRSGIRNQNGTLYVM